MEDGMNQQNVPAPPPAKKGLPGWGIALIVVGALVVLLVLAGVLFVVAGAAGWFLYSAERDEAAEIMIQQEEEIHEAMAAEAAAERDAKRIEIEAKIKELEEKGELTEEEQEQKRQLEEMLEMFQ
jgi:hypothetical protein